MTTVDDARSLAQDGVGDEMVDQSAPEGPTQQVDCLIVHQFDAARPSPGGIDTCIRGLITYSPAGMTIAIAGVDSGAPVAGRTLGVWELHQIGGRDVWFLPVARLDPGNQARLIPHALRLMAGVSKYRSRLPQASVIHAHRADTALAVRTLLGHPLVYFIHTQEGGLTSATSDSVWRFAGRAHAAMERSVVGGAAGVVVFNPAYAEVVHEHNELAIFSPTWFDPALLAWADEPAEPHRVVWVGRLEEPKDPALALEVFSRLLEAGDDLPWTLEIVGAGTLATDLETKVAALPAHVAERVRLRGRLTPREVAEVMGGSGVFLMTSHPGYEGFPMVLVEALASGLPAVVTEGSDTGGIISRGLNGMVSARDPGLLAAAIMSAVSYDRDVVRKSADAYSAPELVGRIFDATFPTEK
ncbi:glycosyltransferase [Pengzhenrongella sicca]|uniref:Glycosyltransferase n=1 Tax=Pengzhenrongella sicca TaxID=2819238 RepID=A0A8A4ZD16_9MICO|nr:glycosyltransferase [Pengzhenrongella sicca]QTE28909.1 glycosyltransferase [Pengzhenrongella sicca]